MKNNKGITLVALVITVIVLLILAAVAITMITGGDGIFAKANTASHKYNEAAKNEATELDILTEEIDNVKVGKANANVGIVLENSTYAFAAKATINITDTELDYSNNILLKVVGNDTYGDIGNNGGEVTFTATDQELKGNIEIDDISKVRFNLNNSHYEGQINGNDSSKAVDITFDKTSTWTLTGDSYINTLTIQNGKISRLSRSIKSNGYDIYYNANLNEWLNGKTIRLSGGGKLIPVFYES